MGVRRFTGFILAFVIAGLLGAFVALFATWGSAFRSCRQYWGDDAYLAYCNNDKFAYYEHGALYLGLEPKAMAALRRAQVIFFGNSRVQHAFSTDAVRTYFKNRAISFYLLGFSYDEAGAFPMAIVQKQRLAPKVIIINTEEFFVPSAASPVARELIDSDNALRLRVRVWGEYLAKKAFVAAQGAICSLIPSACTQSIGAIYRRYADGTWIWRGTYSDDAAHPMPDDQSLLEAWSPPDAQRARDYALRFLAATGVKPDC